MIEFVLFAAITVNWTAPTENVDGSPLTDLDAYRIYYGTAPRTYDQPPIYIEDETLLTYTFTPPPGEWYIAMTAIDADDNESAYSNEIIRTEAGEPLPPIILTEDATAFTVVKQLDRFLLLPVGTVPAGTECNPNETVNGHEVVPNAAVVWSPTTTIRPVVVVAQCDG